MHIQRFVVMAIPSTVSTVAEPVKSWSVAAKWQIWETFAADCSNRLSISCVAHRMDTTYSGGWDSFVVRRVNGISRHPNPEL